MTGSRWRELERLFEQGVALEPQARDEWLARQALEPALHDELRAMLAAAAGDTGLSRRLDEAFAEGAPPVAGTRLGAYRLLRELGSGGMGLVFLAERADEQFRHHVAIKLIRGVAGSHAARQLRHERQILAELVHPNIARLLDGGETPQGEPYLVMEYVPGEPITSACIARGVALEQRVALVRDIALAVHYAHQHLVIHRDIKPANVLLRDDGRPLLLDFGIARLMDEDSRTSIATQPWFTPAYASPEQRRGLPLSTATDVHALGLLLSELLTDKTPVLDTEGAMTAPSLTADASRRPALRHELDRIVLRATAVEPARRYASAEAFADDLQRYLSGKAVQAMPDSLGYRFRKLVQRHPYSAFAIFVAVVLLMFSSWRLAGERDVALQAQAQAQRAREQTQSEAQASQAVTDYLVALFEDADPERTGKTSVTPSELVDRGSKRLAAATHMSAVQRAHLLAAFGKIYINLGLPEKASKALETALQAGDALAPATRAQILRMLAKASAERMRYDDTERHYLEAREILRGLDEPRQLAAVLEGLGGLYTRTDRNTEAEAALSEAVALQTQLDGPDAIETLIYKVSLSEALFNSGRLAQARALLDESIDKLRKGVPPDDFRLITTLPLYGSLLQRMGDTQAAEQVYLEVLARNTSSPARDSERMASIHNNLGTLYYARGESLKAIEQLRVSYEMGQRAGAADDPARMPEMLNLAVLYMEVGDYEQAEPLMRKAATLAERSSDDLRKVMARLNFGRLLTLAGKAEEARLWLEKPVEAHSDPDWIAQRDRRHLLLAEWHRRYGDPRQAQHWLDVVIEHHQGDIDAMQEPYIAAIERTRGLLLAAEGRYEEAQTLLASAGARLVKTRSAQYVGVGSLALESAELFLAEGDRKSARRELQRARAILESQLAANAPERARMEALARELGR